ncbi:hypothetical protein SAY86_028832 [Trapa natans]|uniref:GDSL esterase/lipase n=1 Tax=Trapa natans TaxID=22666 RepID=A0AAN7MJM7_TRANT|nr:hypothetical protein SAY86_028832 [Trapa natans]
MGWPRIAFRASLFLAMVAICIARKVPACFVFGDSLVDSGNNNYLVSLAKANYNPNGIDFGGPTGRFTNGRTVADILDEELGFEGYTPPYLAPTTVWPVIQEGVNYGSGASGILKSTGTMFGGRIYFGAQIDNFASSRQEIISHIGEPAALELLRQSLFSVTIGSNDLINNYLLPVVSAVEQVLVSPEVFIDSMISSYMLQLTRLYDMGARKILVVNMGPIGCIPFERDTDSASGNSCADRPNQMARMFNVRLEDLVSQLRSTLQGSIIVYADVYRTVVDVIENYASYGFDNANSSCCSITGNHGGLLPCGPPSVVCSDRSKYIFWDSYHPSDAANSVIAKRLMDGGPDDIRPMNIHQLADL